MPVTQAALARVSGPTPFGSRQVVPEFALQAALPGSGTLGPSAQTLHLTPLVVRRDFPLAAFLVDVGAVGSTTSPTAVVGIYRASGLDDADTARLSLAEQSQVTTCSAGRLLCRRTSPGATVLTPGVHYLGVAADWASGSGLTFAAYEAQLEMSRSFAFGTMSALPGLIHLTTTTAGVQGIAAAALSQEGVVMSGL